jgi:hypothetical protein
MEVVLYWNTRFAVPKYEGFCVLEYEGFALLEYEVLLSINTSSAGRRGFGLPKYEGFCVLEYEGFVFIRIRDFSVAKYEKRLLCSNRNVLP